MNVSIVTCFSCLRINVKCVLTFVFLSDFIQKNTTLHLHSFLLMSTCWEICPIPDNWLDKTDFDYDITSTDWNNIKNQQSYINTFILLEHLTHYLMLDNSYTNENTLFVYNLHQTKTYLGCTQTLFSMFP